jgi:hypothetical protein
VTDKTDAAPAAPSERRLGETLASQARKRPLGGRTKWILWAVFGVPVVVICVLQMFNVLKNPVAEKVLERRRAEQKAPPPPRDPQTPPGK